MIKVSKNKPMRSDCPLSMSLEIWGDKWSLLILRDMLFRGFTSYKEFMQSGESISTNILADRLTCLEEQGMINRRKAGNRVVYTPTKQSIALIPVLVEMILWGLNYNDETFVDPSVVEEILQGSDIQIPEDKQELRSFMIQLMQENKEKLIGIMQQNAPTSLK